MRERERKKRELKEREKEGDRAILQKLLKPQTLTDSILGSGHLVVGVLGERVSDHKVDGQVDLHVLLGGLLQQVGDDLLRCP